MIRHLVGDVREQLPTLPAGIAQTCVTSPPYWGLRDYGVAGQIGLEESPEAYIDTLVGVFRGVRRALAPDGTLWLNLGDTYASKPQGPALGASALEGSIAPHAQSRLANALRKPNGPPAGLKHKDLVGIPWRVALALQADGWWLRSDIVWHKPNGMPESVTDRPTKSHEYVFLLAKAERYYYNASAIKEPQSESERTRRQREMAQGLDRTYELRRDQPHGQHPPGRTGCSKSAAARQRLAASGVRNSRSVWTIPTRPFTEAHFATFPPALAERCILAGSRPNDTVLDPFGGAGTTGLVADRLGRDAILIELNAAYAQLSRDRITADAPLIAEVGS